MKFPFSVYFKWHIVKIFVYNCDRYYNFLIILKIIITCPRFDVASRISINQLGRLRIVEVGESFNKVYFRIRAVYHYLLEIINRDRFSIYSTSCTIGNLHTALSNVCSQSSVSALISSPSSMVLQFRRVQHEILRGA